MDGYLMMKNIVTLKCRYWCHSSC